jgi:hypothetical protein
MEPTDPGFSPQISEPCIHISCPLRMSTFTHSLTQEEKTLHHWAAMLKKKLEAYHACESREEKAWIGELNMLLVFILVRSLFRVNLCYFRENQWTILPTL